jgi:hypothetical protein
VNSETKRGTRGLKMNHVLSMMVERFAHLHDREEFLVSCLQRLREGLSFDDFKLREIEAFADWWDKTSNGGRNYLEVRSSLKTAQCYECYRRIGRFLAEGRDFSALGMFLAMIKKRKFDIVDMHEYGFLPVYEVLVQRTTDNLSLTEVLRVIESSACGDKFLWDLLLLVSEADLMTLGASERLDAPDEVEGMRSLSDCFTFVWAFLGHFFKNKWVDRCPELQARAIESPSSNLMESMLEFGLYESTRNSGNEESLFFAHNVAALKQLLSERSYDMEKRLFGKTILQDRLQNNDKSQVRILLQAGADAASLLGLAISPSMLKVIFEVKPAFTNLLAENVSHLRRILFSRKGLKRGGYIVLLLKRVGLVVPDELIMEAIDSNFYSIVAPLVCLKVIPLQWSPGIETVLQSVPETERIQHFIWQPHVHRFCAPVVKLVVKTILLTLKRRCPRMPREIRLKLLLFVMPERK